MPGQGTKQLPPSSIAVNRTRRINAGKNPKRDGAAYAERWIRPAEEYCCDSADGSERRQVYIDKNDGNLKKCPYSGLCVDECMAARVEDALDAESVGSPDVRLHKYLQEEYESEAPVTPAGPIPFPAVPSTPEATQPQTPGAPGGTFDHSPVPPSFSPTQVEFPSEDKQDKEDLRWIQREREFQEQKQDIETLKRAIDNLVHQTTREIDALKREKDELQCEVFKNRVELRALKKQRRMSYVPPSNMDREIEQSGIEDIVDLTLE